MGKKKKETKLAKKMKKLNKKMIKLQMKASKLQKKMTGEQGMKVDRDNPLISRTDTR